MSNMDNFKKQYDAAVGEYRALVDGIESEGREWSSEDDAQLERINDAITTAEKRMQAIKVAEEARASVEDVVRPVEERKVDADVELRNFLMGKAGSGTRSVELRDLLKGTPSAGGYTVPVGFVPNIVATLEASIGALMVNPTVLNTDSGNTIKVPTVTAYTAVAKVAEASAVASETDPTFGEVSLGAFDYRGFTQASVELLQDSGVDIEAFIGRQLAEQAGRAFDSKVIAGTGTAEPQGIFTGFSAAVTAASASLTLDNIIDLVHSVNDGYRNGAYFLMKDTTVAAVRKLKDTTNNYLWQPSNIPGVPATLLGYPVVSDAFAPAVGTGNKSIAFGNFNRGYIVRIVKNAGVQVSPDFAFDKGLVSWRLDLRGDGAVADAGAVKLLVHA